VRIGVDATSWLNRRGFGRFARNAVTRLVELDGDTHYVLYIDAESAVEATLPRRAEITRLTLSRRPADAASADSSRPLADLLRQSLRVRRDRLDAFLFPSVYTYFPVFGVPTVVGLHDATGETHPGLTFPSTRSRLFWRAKQRLALTQATRLFTVSESARAELGRALRIPAERLPVVFEAPDPAFHRRRDGDVARALREVGLDARSQPLLYSGGISPHKNVQTLLDAYAALAGAGTEVPPLVIVGDLETEVYVSAAGSIRRRIADLGLGERVVLPGFVPDETLAGLYSAATAVVIPSLAEGFGLPAVEAAACGAPVVLSDIPAHRETLGEDALFFPPRDAGVLAERIQQLLASDWLRRSLAERSRKRVARYSWEASAGALRELLHGAARRGRGSG
jgi:glycosyltransferase involved in cell wall biosynthesis